MRRRPRGRDNQTTRVRRGANKETVFGAVHRKILSFGERRNRHPKTSIEGKRATPKGKGSKNGTFLKGFNLEGRRENVAKV